MSDGRFADRVVLVTGGASGIGRATAERLAREGATVIATDVQPAEADSQGIEQLECDVADSAAVDRLVTSIVDGHGRLDVLVNCAGVLLFENAHTTTDDQWNRVLAVNLSGTFHCCRAALPHLIESGGNIVNMASSAALMGHPWAAAYSASKGGVLSLSRTLAVEYGRQGVRVNALCPSNVETPIREQFRFPDGVDKTLLERILPFHETAKPDAVAAVVAFIASDDGQHVNGAELRVDGGDLA